MEVVVTEELGLLLLTLAGGSDLRPVGSLGRRVLGDKIEGQPTSVRPDNAGSEAPAAAKSEEPEPQVIAIQRPAVTSSVAFSGFRRTKGCMD